MHGTDDPIPIPIADRLRTKGQRDRRMQSVVSIIAIAFTPSRSNDNVYQFPGGADPIAPPTPIMMMTARSTFSSAHLAFPARTRKSWIPPSRVFSPGNPIYQPASTGSPFDSDPLEGFPVLSSLLLNCFRCAGWQSREWINTGYQ